MAESKIRSINACKVLNQAGSNGFVVHNLYMTHAKILSVYAFVGQICQVSVVCKYVPKPKLGALVPMVLYNPDAQGGSA